MNLNEQYRAWLHMRRPDVMQYASGEDVPMDADAARVRRDKASHRGIGRRTALRELAVSAVNQDFLDEIGELIGLEYLELGYPVTATDLRPLTALRSLRHMTMDSPRAITDFTRILELPALERLFIENAKHLTSLDWLRPLKGRLRVLGIEGSLWTKQRIPTLKPLEDFALEGLFLTGTILDDQDLSPIATMPNIKFLGTAINAPRSQFEALRRARPELECDWFDPQAWVGMNDPKPPTR
jgi:hypothetical protein